MVNNEFELLKTGYKCSPSLMKKINFFHKVGMNEKNRIPAMLLTGQPGAGKTALAEAFAKAMDIEPLFIQCHYGINSDNFIIQPNIVSVLKKDDKNAISDGILIRALKEEEFRPTVLIIDELDKASADSDSLLLDFLNSGRVSNGNEEWKRSGKNPVWVFITSNENRELDDSLLNRCRQVVVEKIKDADILSSILNVDRKHHVIKLLQRCDEFSIRQAKEYLLDINFEDKINVLALEQYIDCSNIEREISVVYEPTDDDYQLWYEERGKYLFIKYSADEILEIIYHDEHPKRFSENRLFNLYQIEKILKQTKINLDSKETFDKIFNIIIDREYIEDSINCASGAVIKLVKFDETVKKDILLKGYYEQGLFIAEVTVRLCLMLLNYCPQDSILIDGEEYIEEEDDDSND